MYENQRFTTVVTIPLEMALGSILSLTKCPEFSCGFPQSQGKLWDNTVM
jgi:hypothetical protein